MRYTLLRVTEEGVVLREQHRRRLAAFEGATRETFDRFCASAAPGVFALRLEDDGRLLVEARSGSRLFDGMPARLAVSPFASGRGAFAKPASPCAYDEVRLAGVSTLLTSADGREILESCSAAVLGWEGQGWICVPADRPRVWSTAEAAIRARVAVREAPLLVRDALPIVLVNAVKGVCRVALARSAVPEEAIAALDAALEASVAR